MSEFVAGFAGRHDTAAHLLQAAFAPPQGFTPREMWATLERAMGGDRDEPRSGPKHFSPADPGGEKPTQGWDPLDAQVEPTGFIDPVETAHAAGYAEGLAAAAAAARESGDRDRALLTELTAALANGHQLDRDRIATQLRQTVLLLVNKLVGECGVTADVLNGRIAAAAEMLADASESALLRLNPEDLPLVEASLPKSIFAAGDASLPRGSFVLESASTLVEDGPELWLGQLAEAIDRVPVPALEPR
ncbi:flagellar assembly protein FliH [Sphingomonadaceae bacterium OTU29MARTA1]|uniref:FliH/SctL family protein n=1 Tax=Sphingomonas sp. Leaf37 TaxID=2876552 RepID=UPI001E4A75FE|nr:FliH/SctL family protein [Sphingomonas sp. Leaf37]USU03543.1 flagellar assembly protein FliH [Sphingomonadaceae bacterium OTU29LAMAA1]USU10394.1 flagellar assembly protein FliH [Sphingomonadaceae bacterium OTU29MARTA1]USU10778.1 flagellar assembly protein FliH [Sphingomonadaceae bacterium OTU29THOMA1]